MKESKKMDVIEKIKKLFALSKSSYEHEAALAIAKAKELLTKYNISESELEEEIIKKEYNSSNVIMQPLKFYKYKRITVYKDWIITHIGDFFGCQVYRDYPLLVKKNESEYEYEYYKCLVYIGFPLDVKIAEFVAEQVLNFLDNKFEYYRKTFNKIKKSNGSSANDNIINKVNKKFKESYTYGVITDLNEKMKKFISYKKSKENSNLNVSKYDKLLAIKENAIQEFIGKNFGMDKNTEKEITIHNGIADLGKNDATNELNLNIGVDSGGFEKNMELR